MAKKKIVWVKGQRYKMVGGSQLAVGATTKQFYNEVASKRKNLKKHSL